MGKEQTCNLVIDGHASTARVLLETDELIVRGELRTTIPFSSIDAVSVNDGALTLSWSGREARLELGDHAAKWLHAIQNPKSVIDKIGIKAGQSVGIEGKLDEAFAAQLQARGARLADSNLDALFLAANDRNALAAIRQLRARLAPAGAFWIVRPKGSAAISENDVRQAGLEAGLVDVKVVRFSATHTAEKFVIPLRAR